MFPRGAGRLAFIVSTLALTLLLVNPHAAEAVDTDMDGVDDAVDNCPSVANPSQTDTDGDGLGDACDPCPNDRFNDFDGDAICGDVDNCAALANPDQTDTDGDGRGDACDTCPNGGLNVDTDNDGVCDALDRCPGADDAVDADADGRPDSCDNCPMNANNGQTDVDGDGIGDACDPCTDIDGDGFGDPGSSNFTGCTSMTPDNCRFLANPSQTDTDSDGLGNACDTCPNDSTNADTDGDGVCDGTDNCPMLANADQTDNDSDGTGNACDTTPNAVQLINYQGRLADPSDAPLNATVTMVFRIVDHMGSPLGWSETQPVTVQNGFFNVLLGSVTPFPDGLFTGAPVDPATGPLRFLEVTVNGETLSPNRRIVSSPYSLTVAP